MRPIEKIAAVFDKKVEFECITKSQQTKVKINLKRIILFKLSEKNMVDRGLRECQ